MDPGPSCRDTTLDTTTDNIGWSSLPVGKNVATRFLRINRIPNVCSNSSRHAAKMSRPLGVVTKRNRARSPAHKEFIEALKREHTKQAAMAA